MHYLYLEQFSIKVQIDSIYLLFIHILRSIFPYLITEGCDGRTCGQTDGETQLFFII